jgi:hypothetical protein
VVNRVDFARNVGQAVDAERIDANGPGGRVIAEAARIPAAVQAELARRGHVLAPVGEYDIRPRVQIAGIDVSTGRRVGQSDPRTDFAALAARRPEAAGGAPRDDLRPPTVRLSRRVRGGSVRLSWRGRDRGGAGIASYVVQVREPGATLYRTLLGATARTRYTVRRPRRGTHAFRVRAVDAGGNVSRYDAARIRVR